MDSVAFSWKSRGGAARRSVIRRGLKSMVLVEPDDVRRARNAFFQLVTSPNQLSLNITMSLDTRESFFISDVVFLVYAKS